MSATEGGFLSILHASQSEPFSLDEKNPEVSQWKNFDVFQNNPLGLVVFLRSYSRLISDGSSGQRRETPYDVFKRVVNACYCLQQEWIEQNRLGWDSVKAQRSAVDMFTRMNQMKFLPAGRGLFAFGTAVTEERHLYESLLNCAFTSTENIDYEKAFPFVWAMYMSFVGVGVATDIRGKDRLLIRGPNLEEKEETYTVEDSREGWVRSLEKLINCYVDHLPNVIFDLSQIRPEGVPLKSFGGYASGPEPLNIMLTSIRNIFVSRIGKTLSGRNIADIMNLIARAVIAGGVRRTAMLILGGIDDEEFLNLKNYDLYPERKEFGWTSNNSIIAPLGSNYANIVKKIIRTGEPGFFFLENAQKYSRMGYPPDFKDMEVRGTNPCFSGDTLIGVADGRGAVPIRKLAEEEKDVPVYSVNKKTGKIEIKWGRYPRVTGYDKKLYRVAFDNGKFVDVTGNHKFITTDGKEKTTLELEHGDSISRMKKYFNHEYYREYKNMEIHQQVMFFMDFEKLNGRHPTLEEFGENFPEKHTVEDWENFVELATNYNHRVDSVVGLDGLHTVYNITVDDNHTVCLSLSQDGFDGVFTTNCGEINLVGPSRYDPENPSKSQNNGDMCNLSEVFPNRCTDLQDFIDTLEKAYIYTKTITLGKSSWCNTNRNMLKNRRLGISLSGIQQFIADHGLSTFKQWCEEGYKAIVQFDDFYSGWMSIPHSIKYTCIKPSGTLSLLANCTAGMHFPESRYCIRRVTVDRNSPLVKILSDAGYHIEDSAYDHKSKVVEFPITYGDKIRTLNEVSMFEQLEMEAFLQAYWADNSVSATVTFNKNEAKDIEYALNLYQYRLKGVTFLPRLEGGAYPQMPYEGISKEKYEELVRGIRPINYTQAFSDQKDAVKELWCDGDHCIKL
jgi:ribonucleotide reductase alpha subunit